MGSVNICAAMWREHPHINEFLSMPICRDTPGILSKILRGFAFQEKARQSLPYYPDGRAKASVERHRMESCRVAQSLYGTSLRTMQEKGVQKHTLYEVSPIRLRD